MFWIIKFSTGWLTLISVMTLSLICNLIMWNWKEVADMEIEVVINNLLGKSVWEAMTFGKKLN